MYLVKRIHDELQFAMQFYYQSNNKSLNVYYRLSSSDREYVLYRKFPVPE